MKTLIKNAKVTDQNSSVLDILLDGEKILEIGENLGADGAKVIDAGGLDAFFGFCDMHTHLREPGYEYKEDIASGALAAAHGGYSCVACMANTSPAADSPAVIEFIKNRGKQAGFARVFPIGAITKGLEGTELSEMGALKAAGAVALSDDGKPVANANTMRLALQYASHFGILLISHCEVRELAAEGFMNEGFTASLIGLKGIPAAAETIMVTRDILLAESLGTRVHIAHVSTKGSVDAVRAAKARGVRVTCETAPHYFSATDELCSEYDTNTKMNPPLRAPEDVGAIKQGLSDGTIDAIATDHAPHHLDEKRCEFANAANGIIGLETAFSLCATHLVNPGLISKQRLAQLLCSAPRSILSLEGGVLEKGAAADITLVDFNADVIYDESDLYSKARNSPFLHQPLKGRVAHTFIGGRHVIENGRKSANDYR